MDYEDRIQRLEKGLAASNRALSSLYAIVLGIESAVNTLMLTTGAEQEIGQAFDSLKLVKDSSSNWLAGIPGYDEVLAKLEETQSFVPEEDSAPEGVVVESVAEAELLAKLTVLVVTLTRIQRAVETDLPAGYSPDLESALTDGAMALKDSARLCLSYQSQLQESAESDDEMHELLLEAADE